MKGNQIILIAILVVIIAGAGSYLYFKREHKQYLPAAFAVPESAVAAYEGMHPKEDFAALSQNELYRSLSGNPAIDSFNREYHYMDSLLSKNEDIQQSLSVHPLIVSLHVTGANDFQLLFLHQTEEEFTKNDIQQLISDIVPNSRLQERKYEETSIYDVKGGDAGDLLSFAYINGIIAISRNPVLVEDAINAYNKNRSHNSQLVEQMVQHKTESKIYINFQQWPSFLNTYLQVQYHDDVLRLQQLASVGVYDWKLEGGKVMLQGELMTDGTPGQLWASLIGEQPQPVGLPQVLPGNTAIFMEWGVGNFNTYLEKYKNYLTQSQGMEDWEKERSSLMDSTGLSLDSDIVPVIGNNWGYALLEPLNDLVEPEMLLYLRASDTTNIMDKLHALNEKAAKHAQGITAPQLYRGYKIERTNYSGVFGVLFGTLFSHFEKPFYTRLGDYVVFGRNVQVVQRCIDAFLDNQTLAQSATWKQYAANLASRANYTLFIDPSRSVFLASRYIRNTFSYRFQQNLGYYKMIGGAGFQLVANDKDFFSQVILQQSGAQQGGTEMAWSQSLETEAISKPYIVDAQEPRQKEILVQDQNYNLYLFNNSGSIEWKKKLDDALVGEVYVVDYYHNGQKQYLFATTNDIHLVDHSGKETGSYPIRLASPTSTGIALFDFENNDDYQYFVGVQKKVYGFNVSGKPLQGWSPQSVSASISLPLKYFSIQGKVYLFGVGSNGALYVWDEKGKQAMTPIDLKTQFTNPFKANIAASLPQTTLFSVDTAGVLYQVQLDGTITKRTFNGFGKKPYFDYYDTDGNGKYEYVLAGGNMIASYEKDTTAAWRFSVSSPLEYAPQFVNLNGKTWIGYSSVPENVIYLRSRAGTQYAGFPVRGSKPFAMADLNGDGSMEMITVGDGGKVYMYRIGR